jgi:glutathione S-transferase
VIRLYRAEWSTNCERVGLALAHKGLGVESVVIQYSDRSLVERVSGQGLVPVIEDDGTVVADSTAILRYLEERFPDSPLFPADPARRAEVDVFLDWFNEVWKRPANELEEVLEGDSPDATRVDALSSEIQASLPRFEGLLAGREFLMGDALGAADFAAFPFLKYGLHRDPADTELFHVMLDEHQDLGEMPRLRAWIERVNGQPRAF